MDFSSTAPNAAPVLIASSHGTRSPSGQTAVDRLVTEVARRLPGVRVVNTWVDVQQPDLGQRTRELSGRDAVVVPLLLSAGYHVFVDMARAVAGRPEHAVAAALGPDRRLATVLARRLREALAHAHASEPDAQDTVIMVAAGSSDAAAVRDCELAARYLAEELGRPVIPAYLSAATPSLADAVAEHSTAGPGRVLVASYLLAPGYFQSRAESAGADVTAGALLSDHGEVPDELVELVIEHYSEIVENARTPVGGDE